MVFFSILLSVHDIILAQPIPYIGEIRMSTPNQTPPPGSKTESLADYTQNAEASLPSLAAQVLRTMAGNVGVGVILYDRDLRILFWNTFMENLTGSMKGEVLGRCALDLFPHMRAQGAALLFQEALAGKTVYSDDTLFTVPGTGKSGWTQRIYSPYVDTDGTIVGILAIIHDISGRKAMEEALRTKEEFLRGVLDSVQDGLSVLDRDMNILMTNPAQEKRYARGMPLRGKKCFEIYQQRCEICTWCPSSLALRTGNQESAIVPYPNAKSPTHWLELTAFPMRNTQGEITGVVGHSRDITEKKQYDERLAQQMAFLETVIESLPYPFCVINVADHRIVMANALASQQQDWHGQTCHQLTHHRDTPCDGAEHRCPLLEVKCTGQPVIMEHIHFDTKGNRRYIEVHGYPIFDDHGQMVQMIEYGLDITERHLFEEERNQLIVDLQRALKEVKTMSGLLPICAWCKKIRDDKGYWSQVESYMGKHTAAQFSHSICPDCMLTKFPEPDDKE